MTEPSPQPQAAVIHMQNVWKTYRTGAVAFTALKAVDLTISSGSFVAIMGPSGSGKSTLMNLIGLLDNMDDGDYSLNGIRVDDLSDDELAHLRNQEIGFVFQSFNLLPRLNVLENVELPLVYAGVPGAKRKKMAIDALASVGLADWLLHRPTEISGGQKQRVAVARATVTKPTLLLADEPTGNLDSQSTQEILELFHTLHQDGTTIVLITHEADVAKHAEEIILMHDGRITERQKQVRPVAAGEKAGR